MKCLLPLLAASLLAGCAHPGLSPIPLPGQTIKYQQGRPTTLSHKRSAVAVTVAEVTDHAKLFVTVANGSGGAANIDSANVAADSQGNRLKVFSARDLTRNERTAAVFGAIGAGGGGAARISEANQPVRTTSAGTIYAPNGQALATYSARGTTFDPASAALAQAAINADTRQQLAGQRSETQARMAEIGMVLQTTTVRPGGVAGGMVEINNTGMHDPVNVHVAFVGEEHTFRFHLGN